MSHKAHVVVWAFAMVGWAVAFVPLWLLTEGVGKALRWLVDTHSPSGY